MIVQATIGKLLIVYFLYFCSLQRHGENIGGCLDFYEPPHLFFLWVVYKTLILIALYVAE